MRKTMLKSVLLVVSLLLGTQLVIAQQPLPIARVLLYKNGMAYIVRSGQLTAPLSLTFHPEDMNDVLKSFSAWNPDSGALYSVGYTAGVPSSRMLGRFPFDLAARDTGLGDFLTQVKGAAIRLSMGTTTLQGVLAAVQRTDRVVAQTSTSDYRLTVQVRDGSLQTVWLSDVRSVEFVDPRLRDQLKAYLDVLAQGRQDVTREVSIYPVPAAGPIRVAYLQQFPLWKTSYRVDLGDRESRIQGWAQIDNPTGESWNNVEVSLLSGSPVSFIMNLYEPLYTNRATVGVPGAQVAAPRQYEAAVRTAQDGGLGRANAPQGTTFAAGGRGGAGSGGGTGRGAGVGPMAESVTVTGAAPIAGVQSAARVQAESLPDATQVEDFFEYTFPFPVQLASRQSALLPFLQKTLNVERLSIFNARADRGNPRIGAEIQNATDIPFEPGPVTFFESGRYAGEAVLNYLSRGEKSLVSYGVDHDVQIASKLQNRPETTTRLTVSHGIAVLFTESVVTTTYEIRNKGGKKTLVVEHPRVNDRTLKGVEPWETTGGFYRFRLNLEASQEITLPVGEVIARQTQVALNSLRRNQLAMFAGKETPQAVRDTLGRIVEVQEQIAALQSDIGVTNAAIDGFFRDQERLRENIKALHDTREEQQLRRRYLDQLSKQEDQIQSSRAHADAVSKDVAAAGERLGDLISNLSWGG